MKFRMQQWRCPKCNQLYYGCNHCYDCNLSGLQNNEEKGGKIHSLEDLILPDYKRRNNFLRLKRIEA